MVDLSNLKDKDLRLKAMRVLGNFAASDNNITKKLLTDSVFNRLKVGLISDEPEIRSKSAWMLSNLTTLGRPTLKLISKFGLL